MPPMVRTQVAALCHEHESQRSSARLHPLTKMYSLPPIGAGSSGIGESRRIMRVLPNPSGTCARFPSGKRLGGFWITRLAAPIIGRSARTRWASISAADHSSALGFAMRGL
jgi:hypothetical protein